MISIRNVSRENTLGGVGTVVPAQVVDSSSGIPDDESVGNQPVKKMAFACREAPSKVNVAVGTHSNTPYVASKPGELGGTGPNIDASPGMPVAGYFKNDTFRIGKRLRVCAVDHRALCS